jgi:molybdopterin/thiamine biosynthesis adenylyltransferase
MVFDSRYSRQILFSAIGADGQTRLRQSSVLLVGCGALGSVSAEILVRAGIGRLRIADRDYVDETNLQRQALFTEQDCLSGLPKAVAAARHLREINSQVDIEECVVDVDSRSIGSLLLPADLIVDGTDNFEARYLLNDASLKWGIPWVYGACVGAYGLCTSFLPGLSPCLRCLLEEMPPVGSSPTCDTSGVLGPIVHAVAAMETAEALKILTGNVQHLSRKLTSIDLWENRFVSVDLSGRPPDPECPACGKNQFEFLSGERESKTENLCGSGAVQIRCREPLGMPFEELALRLAPQARVVYNEYLLKAQWNDIEIAQFRDGRAIVRGAHGVDEARRFYAKFIGL